MHPQRKRVQILTILKDQLEHEKHCVIISMGILPSLQSETWPTIPKKHMLVRPIFHHHHTGMVNLQTWKTLQVKLPTMPGSQMPHRWTPKVIPAWSFQGLPNMSLMSWWLYTHNQSISTGKHPIKRDLWEDACKMVWERESFNRKKRCVD